MAALRSRCGHYIFQLWFLPIFLLPVFSSPNLCRRRLDVYHTYTHDVVLLRIKQQQQRASAKLCGVVQRLELQNFRGGRHLHRVSKNVPPLAYYNFDVHEWILIFFGRNVTDKVCNQKTLYYSTSNNLCFCTTCQNGETRKSYISLSWIVLHTMHLCAVFLKEKLSSVMYVIASNIW